MRGGLRLNQEVTAVRRGIVDRKLLVALLLVAAPFVVILARVLVSHYLTTSDLALTELHIRDVGGKNTPLVGVISRYNWNHPGPLYFYVLAVPYRILGSTGSALLFGGVLINLVAVAACLLLLRRRGGGPGVAVGLLVLFVLLRALGGGFLVYPWNPYVVVLPMLVLALVCWCVLCGDHRMLPIAVALASFTVETHVGTTGVAVALVVTAFAGLAYDARRGRAPDARRTTLIAAGVGLLLWIPPIIDQLKPGGGNLSALWRYWTSSHNHVTGWTVGMRIVAAQLSLPAPWITGHQSFNRFTGGLDPHWQVPWALILLIAAAARSWRRRNRESFALAAIVLVFIAVAVVSAARVVDTPFDYLLRWTWLAGALAWLEVAWVSIRAVDLRSRPRVLRASIAAAAAAMLALAVATTVSGARAHLPDVMTEQAIQHVDGALVDTARRLPQPVIVNAADFSSQLLANAILVRLVHLGIRAGLEAGPSGGVGDYHVVSRRSAHSLVTAVSGEQIAAYRNDPRYRLIASYDSLAPDDRAFVQRVESTPTARLEARSNPQEWRRFTALAARDDRAAVFVAALAAGSLEARA